MSRVEAGRLADQPDQAVKDAIKNCIAEGLAGLKERLRFYFQDDARIGKKGRVCHIWWKRGERPPGLVDQRPAHPVPQCNLGIERITDHRTYGVLMTGRRVAS